MKEHAGSLPTLAASALAALGLTLGGCPLLVVSNLAYQGSKSLSQKKDDGSSVEDRKSRHKRSPALAIPESEIE